MTERARYIRKHGHGRPWRHSFIVTDVKPHAVKLEIPTDGSVPEVLPWQSLRKCSFAAPHFHHQDLELPELDQYRLPIVNSPDGDWGWKWVRAGDALPTPDNESEGVDDLPRARAPSQRMSAWTTIKSEDELYEIERIVGARRSGRGWTLDIKWKGYDHATPEPLSRVLKTVTDQSLLAEIEDQQRNYYDKNPTEQTVLDREDYEPPQPTRVQPKRANKLATVSVHGAHDSATVHFRKLNEARHVNARAMRKAEAIAMIRPDFCECPISLKGD